MTAYSMQGDAERFRADGFDDYVAKPVTSRELLAALRRQAPHLPVEAIASPAAADHPEPALAPDASDLRPDPAVLAQLLEVGGAEFVEQLFADFVADAAPQLEQAAHDLAAGHLPELLAPVHQLKGASAQLGLTAIAEVARRLEQLLRQPAPLPAAVAADFALLRLLFTTFAATYPAGQPPVA